MQLYVPTPLIVLTKRLQAEGRNLIALTAIGGVQVKDPDRLLSERDLLRYLAIDHTTACALDAGLPKLQAEALIYFDEVPAGEVVFETSETNTPLPLTPEQPGGGLLPDWSTYLKTIEASGTLITVPSEPLVCAEGLDWAQLNCAPEVLRGSTFFQPGTGLHLHGQMSLYVPRVQVACLLNRAAQTGVDSRLQILNADTAWLFPQRELGVFFWRGLVEEEEAQPLEEIVFLVEPDEGTPLEHELLFERWSRDPGEAAWLGTGHETVTPLFAPEGTLLADIHLTEPLPELLLEDPSATETINAHYAALAASLGVDPAAGVEEPPPELNPVDISAEELIPKLRANGIHDPGLESKLLDAERITKINRQKTEVVRNQIRMMLS